MENEQAAGQADNLVQGIKAAVAKNRNQPTDMVHLGRAEALHTQVASVLSSLYACNGQLRHLADRTSLRQPAPSAFPNANGPAAQRWQELRQQLAACADSLRRASPAAARPVFLPAAAPATTAVQALADLACAGKQLLASEASVLRQIGRAVSHRPLLFKSIVLATADDNILAPGDTYRAWLLVASYLPADVHQVMSCNGRPVPIDSLGIGRVRFRAPLHPGPAAWTGTVRFNYLGRDSTFVVRVPYRVARR